MDSVSQSRIIVLGSANVDLVLRAKKLPRPGETILGGRFFQAAGGKGANQAVAAARAGRGGVVFLTAVGDDDFGRQSLEAYQQEGLDCRFARVVSGAATGTALIFVDAAGENMIGVASGANLRLAPEDVDAVPEVAFADARVFLTSLETPLETVERGLQRARASGLRTILNPAPARADVAAARILQLVDVFTPNEGEAAALAGTSLHEGDSLAERLAAAGQAAVKLKLLGTGVVIVTLGSAGCLVVDGDTTHLPGFSVNAVDATAAGDAFNGALGVALSEGKSLHQAAEWANRAASIAVTRAGAQPSLPRRDEIDR